jgi:hypothetical protein
MNKLVMFAVGAFAATMLQGNQELVATIGADGSFIENSKWFPIIAGVILTFVEGSDWPPIVKKMIRGLFKDNVDTEGAEHIRKLLNDALDFLAYLKRNQETTEVIKAQEKVVELLSERAVKEEVGKQ